VVQPVPTKRLWGTSHSSITVTSGTEEMLYIIAGPEARKVATLPLDLPSFG
jgi:hypothetical protein